MAPRKVLVSAAVVVALLTIGLVLVAAPLHRPYTIMECSSAYARAHSRADTARVDLHRLTDESGARDDRRCGSTRTVASQPGAAMLVP